MESLPSRCVQCNHDLNLTRMQCVSCGLSMEGHFVVPPLAKLSVEDQAFVMSFVRTHGNLKKMEELFSISYPTVKNRLNAITRVLDETFRMPNDPEVVLARLERGEITAAQAADLLK